MNARGGGDSRRRTKVMTSGVGNRSRLPIFVIVEAVNEWSTWARDDATPRERLPRASRSHSGTSPGACGLAALAILLAAVSAALAQERPYHYFYSADMPPGAIGAAQLMRGGPLPGYFQPVEITAPQDTQVALAMDGVFDAPQPAPLRVGLLVGNVYRLKVTNIPFRAGQEVFPSIEIINRLYPPPGSEAKFPIPIELTREELELAIRGHYVVRVIYLENPAHGPPRRDRPAPATVL